VRKTLALMGLAALLGGGCAASNLELDTSAQATFDGLLPVRGTTMQKVWAREGLDLRSYDKFMPTGVSLQYRPVGSVNRTSKSSAREFPLTEQQKDTIEKIANEEFAKALSGVTRMALTDVEGPHTLLVKGSVIDIVSRVPPERPGRTDYYLDSVGQATFVIELIDSESDTVLARGIDTRSAETPGYTYRSSRATNVAEVRRLARYWADLLVNALNNLETIPELND